MILEMPFFSAKMSKEKKNIGQVGRSLGPDSTPKQAPIRPGDRKNLSMSNLQETKVSLSAIRPLRAL